MAEVEHRDLHLLKADFRLLAALADRHSSADRRFCITPALAAGGATLASQDIEDPLGESIEVEKTQQPASLRSRDRCL